MLLSNWYIKRKEKQIREAAEEARKQGYEEGYEAGKSEIREDASTNPAQVNQSDTAPTEAAQENQSDTAATNPAQVSEGEAASTSTSPSGLPDDKEKLLEYLKSEDLAKSVKV